MTWRLLVTLLLALGLLVVAMVAAFVADAGGAPVNLATEAAKRIDQSGLGHMGSITEGLGGQGGKDHGMAVRSQTTLDGWKQRFGYLLD